MAHRRRLRWFRALAVVGVPVLLLLVEVVFRLAGVGYSTPFFLPDRVEEQAIWRDNQDFGRRFFPPGLVRYPRSLVIPSRKPPGALRVFVLGESAAMGDPDPKFGFPRMLEVLLQSQFPQRSVEVVNTGVVAINSHVILPIARDCASCEGDIWVVYMGNNEAIGPFGSITVFGEPSPSLPVIRALLALKQTRVVQTLDALAGRLRKGGGTPEEWGGLAMMADQRIRYDDPASAKVEAYFRDNLERILDVAESHGVTVILCSVASNLRDCAPFTSLHRAGLASADLDRWDVAYRAGTNAEAQAKYGDALNFYQSATGIDADHAELTFRIGRCREALGQFEAAAAAYRLARDRDALPVRATATLNDTIKRAAERRQSRRVSFLDAEAVLATHSTRGLIGADHFYEHVHLKPAGNYLLARAVADHVAGALRSDANAASVSARAPVTWLTEAQCLEEVGFTDWNRRDILTQVLGRLEQPPFTRQAQHEEQLQAVRAELESTRAATKPSQIERGARQVAQAVARHPREPDLRWNLAQHLDLAGKSAEAEAEWRELIRLRPHAFLPRFNLAKNLGLRGQDAEGVYRESLSLNPGSSEAHQELGAILARRGELAEAVRHLRTAVRLKPRSVEAQLALAMACAQSQQFGAAEAGYREVLRLDPANVAARQALESLPKGP